MPPPPSAKTNWPRPPAAASWYFAPAYAPPAYTRYGALLQLRSALVNDVSGVGVCRSMISPAILALVACWRRPQAWRIFPLPLFPSVCSLTFAGWMRRVSRSLSQLPLEPPTVQYSDDQDAMVGVMVEGNTHWQLLIRVHSLYGIRKWSILLRTHQRWPIWVASFLMRHHVHLPLQAVLPRVLRQNIFFQLRGASRLASRSPITRGMESAGLLCNACFTNCRASSPCSTTKNSNRRLTLFFLSSTNSKDNTIRSNWKVYYLQETRNGKITVWIISNKKPVVCCQRWLTCQLVCF